MTKQKKFKHYYLDQPKALHLLDNKKTDKIFNS